MRLVKLESTLFYFLLPVKKHILLAKHQSLWRKKNKHNKTVARNVFPLDTVNVGDKTYGEIEYYYFGNKSEGLIIGSYCSIAGNVKFIGGGNHLIKTLSTYPFSRHVYRQAGGEDTNGKIVVEDDVWICDGCTILSGVKIGQGAIIAANSIVTKDVPPYGIWMGNRLVKYRFDEYTVSKLKELDFTKIDYSVFKTYHNIEITKENVDMILKIIMKE